MLKVTIAGCGLITSKKHIPAFLRLKDKVEIAAICDLNADTAKKVADKFGIKKTYIDFADMLLKERPYIVDICTPPQTHAKLTIQAVESGAHVFIEKPMALNTPDCDKMIEAAAKYGKKIYVIHNQMFNPAFMQARKQFLKGEIGDFLGINIILSTPAHYMTEKKGHWAHSLPGGVLGETGPHIAYLALAFLKNISHVDIQAKKLLPEYPWSRFEDFRITLIADNGMGSITLNYASNQWLATIDVLGSKGILKVDLLSRSCIKYNRPKLDAASVGLSTLASLPQISTQLISNIFGYILGRGSDAHQVAITEFVNSILEGRTASVNAKEGRETVRVVEMLVNKL